MEVHKPRAPHSWREFAVEIGTVTLGILIALSLEAMVEAARTHALVEHARSEMRAELARDRGAVANTVAAAQRADAGVVAVEALLKARIKRQPSPQARHLTLMMDFHNLNSGAWESTVATQALAHMPFHQARALSEAYGDVRSFNDFERDASQQWFQIYTLSLDDDADLEMLRDTLAKLRLAQGYVRGLDQDGVQTLATIDAALAALGPGPADTRGG
jgi:hypothetical protein